MRRVGRSKRARDRQKWQRELSLKWQQTPIETCELRFPGCFGTYGLAPAHSKDRFDIHTQADFGEVVAACEKCHWHIDREMPKDERLRIVKAAIADRTI